MEIAGAQPNSFSEQQTKEAARNGRLRFLGRRTALRDR
jgi:hypothetical protein